MTKANERALAKMADAERRANRKIKRLQKKGVRTGSISPFHEVDTSNTRAVNKYVKELEHFISRETRYVAGREGTPIPYSAYRDYKRVERKWNKEHDKYWRKFGRQPFMTSQGDTDMSLAELSSTVHVKGLPYGDVNYRRALEPEKIRGVKDLERRIEILEREMSPEFQRKRLDQLRANLTSFVGYFNDKELTELIESLTDEQLFRLQDFTDFVETFYMHYWSGTVTEVDEKTGKKTKKKVRMELDDALEDASRKEHMVLTIQAIKAKYPDRKSKNSRKRKK